MPVQSAELVCLQCGTVTSRRGAQMCRRCGLRFGEAPPQSARLASCPVCYRSTDDDGRVPSQAHPGRRIDINAHVEEHDRFPVGDDAWLESLRDLVTGVVDAGRNRLAQHNSVVMAMTQIQRWGRDPQILGDQDEWRAARDAVAQLMDRYHAVDARRRFAG